MRRPNRVTGFLQAVNDPAVLPSEFFGRAWIGQDRSGRVRVLLACTNVAINFIQANSCNWYIQPDTVFNMSTLDAWNWLPSVDIFILLYISKYNRKTDLFKLALSDHSHAHIYTPWKHLIYFHRLYALAGPIKLRVKIPLMTDISLPHNLISSN